MCSHAMCRDIDMGRHAVEPRRGPALAAWLAATLVVPTAAGAHTVAASASARVEAHDNTRAAGTVDRSTVTIRLRAARGEWRPEGTDGPPLTIEAFGEEGKTLTVPAPLIRVAEGAVIDLAVRNELATPLRVHGLCSRDGSPCPPVDVTPGGTTQLRFAAGRSGTYHYWATSLGAPSPMREMAGAFVVDPKEGAEPDRIFVITEWNTLTAPEFAEVLAADAPSERFLAARPAVAFMINGLSWPATERLVYRRGASRAARRRSVRSPPTTRRTAPACTIRGWAWPGWFWGSPSSRRTRRCRSLEVGARRRHTGA